LGVQIEFETENLRKSIWIGAMCGATAWTVYAITECFLGVLLSWLIKPGYAYVEWYWGFIGVLFLLYPLIGGVLGGANGLLLWLRLR
jgi:hypothetical protein